MKYYVIKPKSQTNIRKSDKIIDENGFIKYYYDLSNGWTIWDYRPDANLKEVLELGHWTIIEELLTEDDLFVEIL